VTRGAWDDASDRGVLEDIERRFKAAVEVAEKTPKPKLETMFEDVYQRLPWHLAEERDAVVAGPRPTEHG
jgi:TPP-dependent pyruvate/acetoin dehydrogenase alpha subunit